MGSIIDKMLNFDWCVWWQKLPGTDEFGQLSYAFPVEMKCRWEDVTKEVMLKNKTIYVSSATIYVDRDVAPGDMLMHVRLADLESETDSNDSVDTSDTALSLHPEAREVMHFARLPDIRNKKILRTAFL